MKNFFTATHDAAVEEYRLLSVVVNLHDIARSVVGRDRRERLRFQQRVRVGGVLAKKAQLK